MVGRCWPDQGIGTRQGSLLGAAVATIVLSFQTPVLRNHQSPTTMPARFILLSALLLSRLNGAETVHLRSEAGGASVRLSNVSPGEVIIPKTVGNAKSWRFDGRTMIVHSIPSNAEGFEVNFTWEGFFLTPKENTYSTETGIADRLISQFAFDQGNWTRLAIGLVADKQRMPRLGVELEGFEGRTFGMGDTVVLPDRWYHFALVHEGTPDAARIRWYLNHERCGEILLGGQANQNTLRPPGSARITIGARLIKGTTVDRGFNGYMDEIRLTPKTLRPVEFLRTLEPGEKPIDTAALRNQERATFWKARRAWAIEAAADWMPNEAKISFPRSGAELLGDAAFLRRLALTVTGRIPTLGEIEAFLADSRQDKRSRAVERYLASPEWGDGWVGYWQDVLAENPSVVFPTLNNSGPFRGWIHKSFRDNKPFDQFATELMLMEGSGGKGTEDSPASFALATRNDVPMAMRANVALKAFAGVDLKCSRCHDSPVDRFKQADLFQLAAYLNNGPLKVPASSVAAVAQGATVRTTLRAGQSIPPQDLAAHWLKRPGSANDLRPIEAGSPRAAFAALVTSPHNPRFSDVIVNRVWHRYFGTGLIEPVDHWNENPERPELMQHLSAYFVRGGYDMKALARLILNSTLWQTERAEPMRMSAEQLIDSAFLAVGKQFESETMGVHGTDPGSAQLPQPNRAWQFAALPNERDRPALGMPVNQTIVDVMTTFGWKGSRQQPRSEREQITTPLQPLILFNGIMSQRIVRLSDRGAVTELCLEDQPVERLVERLFLTLLSRHPSADERQAFVDLLQPGYAGRKTGAPKRKLPPLTTFQPDWRKHLRPDQTRLMLDAQRRVAKGEAPTVRLTSDFRERVEDCLWALFNSPEFVLVP